MTSSPARTVNARMKLAAERWPDQVAVIDESSSLTYSQLLRRAQEYAAAFARLGLKPGAAMLIMLPTDATFVSVWIGCMLAGLYEVPVNTDYKSETLKHVIVDSQAVAMITTREWADRTAECGTVGALEQILIIDGDARPDRTLEHALAPVLAQLSASDCPSFEPSEDYPIGVLYTSGTTGPSKGAVISHRQAYEYALIVGGLLELKPGDVYYGPLPLFHIAGQWAVVYAAMLYGATAHIRGRFSLSRYWEDCRRSGATASYLLGSMAQLVYNATPQPDDADNSVERMLMVPMVSALADFRRRFGLSVISCYGTTEIGVPIAGDKNIQDPSIIGRRVEGYDLRVVNEKGVDVGNNIPGELLVRSRERDCILKEYFGNEKATKAAMPDGWFRTGDLVQRDAEGNFRFIDRVKDALRRRGENISAFEVEREFYAHPSVFECAAIGVPSAYTEDDLVVYVVLKPGYASEVADELKKFVDTNAPRFMRPDRIILMDEIPKTPTGKVSKHLLRSQALKLKEQESQGRKI